VGRRGFWAATVVVGALAVGRASFAELQLLEHTTASQYEHSHRDDDINAWRTRVPRIQVVRIRSSADGAPQRAVWYDSGSAARKPLLVVLHSWSADYEQNINIPFAEFAINNDWALVHPDFRGPNRRPQATASQLAIQDVIDAVTFARQRAAIDGARIYLVGYSGGAMKALVLAGRYPDLWAGVAAFSGIYDIADWYRYNRGRNARYRKEIAASCGGPPSPGSAAEADCRARSPLSHLEQAAGRVPILIAHGLRDDTVPPRHAIDAYNVLASAGDRFDDAQRAAVDAGQIPGGVRAQGASTEPLFKRAGVPLRLERSSREVTLVLYQGAHDMIYNVALDWFARHHR
jgi:predicted esterase